MSYADYEFYIGEYFGKAIGEADFPRLSLRASSFLDYYTQGRATDHPDMPELKMACCALAEQYQLIDAAQELANKSIAAGAASDSGEVQSETVGSWSKSYRSGGDSAYSALSATANAQVSLSAIARQYLAGTGLLYRGGRCRHGHVSAHCDDL